MAKCKYCGKEIPNNSHVCPYCENPDPFDLIKDQVDGQTSNVEELKVCYRPQYNPNQENRLVPLDKINGMAIAGFVCSIFVPFIGLPFSITAYYRCKTDYYMTNKRYAVAGIIISIVMLALLIILFPIILVAAL